MYIVRWFVREIMFAYVLLCVSSTVVRDTLGPYWFWLGRSGWSDGEPFVANSCDKLGRYCQICTTSVWKRCEICKLWRSCAACEHGIVFDVCQGGMQVFRNLSETFQLFISSAALVRYVLLFGHVSACLFLQLHLSGMCFSLDMFWYVYFFSCTCQVCAPL